MTDAIRQQLTSAWQARYDLMSAAVQAGCAAYPETWWPALAPLNKHERSVVREAVKRARETT